MPVDIRMPVDRSYSPREKKSPNYKTTAWLSSLRKQARDETETLTAEGTEVEEWDLRRCQRITIMWENKPFIKSESTKGVEP